MTIGVKDNIDNIRVKGKNRRIPGFYGWEPSECFLSINLLFWVILQQWSVFVEDMDRYEEFYQD